jgi:DNA-binding response OmpR family regulator
MLPNRETFPAPAWDWRTNLSLPLSFGRHESALLFRVPRKAVLLVEDDVDLRRMLRMTLAFEFRVEEAGDGLEALRLLDIEPPDLIVLDLGLPLISGHVVYQEVAAQAHLRHIPVVVITGGPVAPDLAVACTLRKPFAPDELLQVVRTCLGSGADITNA